MYSPWIVSHDPTFDNEKKEIVKKVVSKKQTKKPRRKIGILEKKGKIKIGKGFKITENEFLGLQ